MEAFIKKLLVKFVDFKLTNEELTQLRNAVSALSDDELKQAMAEVWEQYDIRIEAPVPFEQIAERLSLLKPPSARRKYLQITLKAVATVAILLLIGMQVYLYRMNRQLTTHLNHRQTVQVTSGEKAEITLPDGSTVYLNAATTLTYPSQFGMKQRDVYLTGEAYLKVTKDAARPFHVHTDQVDVEVLGTTFNVCARPNEQETEVTLLEGAVKLIPKEASLSPMLLKPNEKGIYLHHNRQLSVVQTTGYIETAWTKGELVFRSARFVDIIKRLEVRYGVEIEVIGNLYDTDLFTGSFKETSVLSILRLLQMHYHFTYTQENGRIEIIMK
jgi:ferric-dicitrate binding protein FerR (iron transport regulator)